MTPEEKQRMIHIRIDSDVHRELRKAAAEYDVTIQEIVSKAVEDRVEVLESESRILEQDSKRLEADAERLERKTAELERKLSAGTVPPCTDVEVTIDQDETGGSGVIALHVSVLQRLDSIDSRIEALTEEISVVHRLVSERGDSHEA